METWKIYGGDEYSAIFTFRFDKNGDLYYMEYKTDVGSSRAYISSIEVFSDTQQEIREKIQSTLEERLITESFSWVQDEAKYTSGGFNIRQDSFVNTQVSPVTGPVQAARLAKQEYPNLPDEYSILVFRDDTVGMWKVTIETEVAIQSEYEYRDVYLSDSGVT
ncbi:hypothetical protein, partial [Methanomethylophilus alvi]|uniref:hypothetical protein n=1 Tax=Methanomethylophilus alvi TaxID=1291540 RepID=UPI0037DC8C9E